ncbi:MAG: hypothetical protein ACM3H9_07755 [Rhodospirillaceae bacterium]
MPPRNVVGASSSPAVVAAGVSAVALFLGSADLARGLTTRSTTTSTVDADGLLTATANFSSPDNDYAYVARAICAESRRISEREGCLIEPYGTERVKILPPTG